LCRPCRQASACGVPSTPPHGSPQQPTPQPLRGLNGTHRSKRAFPAARISTHVGHRIDRFGCMTQRGQFQLLPGVTRLERVPDRKDQDDILRRKPAVCRDGSVAPPQEDQSAPAPLGRPPELRVIGQQ
jgi:hypothetical protein